MSRSLPAPLSRHRVLGLLGALDVELAEVEGRLAPLGAAAGGLLLALAERLLGLVDRTMVLELAVKKREGALVGETPEARFDDFARRLLHDDELRAALRSEYPVLFARAQRLATNFADAVLEAHGRLEARRAELEALLSEASGLRGPGELGGARLGPPVEVAILGDPHRAGRSVMSFTFAGGARLIYKPRSLRMEAEFARLVEWLAVHAPEVPRLRAIPVVDAGEFGFMPFVESAECADAAAAGRYYERQGAILALMHALAGTDLHHENLLAAGEDPVIVDLECCFTPELGRKNDNAYEAASLQIGRSVLSTGLVPTRTAFGYQDPGVDLSALGARDGKTSSVQVPTWLGIGTDEMKLGYAPMVTAAGDGGPRLGGRPVDVLAHLGDLERGFVVTYRALLRLRGALLAADGPLAGFAAAKARVLLRNTHLYARLAIDSLLPKYGRSEAALAGLYAKLDIDIPNSPWLAELVADERRDLFDSDVPAFWSPVDSRDLVATHRVLPGLLARSGMDVVRARLAELSERDLERQLWMFRASTASVLEVAIGGSALPDERVTATRTALLAEATRIADRLAELAVPSRRGDSVTWIGIEPGLADNFEVRSLAIDLYSGLPGVALFLAELGKVTGEGRHTELAHRAARAIADGVKIERPWRKAPGLYEGWAGVVLSLTRLGRLLDDPALLAARGPALDAIAEHVPTFAAPGLLEGLAGAVAGLAAAGEGLDLAAAAAERVIAMSKPAERGHGWSEVGRPLTGFSHGAAGITWALALLHRQTGDSRLLEAARGGLEYERGVFDPELRNWPDYRPKSPSIDQCLWCHGAPGIGLQRLELLDLAPDDELRREIDLAVATTLERGFQGHNDCLCHGRLGNLELVERAARRFADPALQATAADLSARILAGLRGRWLTGVPGGFETPGLMTGLAGLGYALVRLAAPDEVPSLLTPSRLG